MNARGRCLIVAALLTIGAWPAFAQTMQPTPEPNITAEQEPWYLAGEPIIYAGQLYYRAGPWVFFNRNEMVRSGSYAGVPLYTRTTIEPYSIVFVPIGDSRLQPYERRRTGELAGTVGSTAPNLPVTSEPVLESMAQTPGLPTMVGEFVTTSAVRPVLLSTSTRPRPEPVPVGTSGRVIVTSARRPPGVDSILRPSGINAVFVEFGNTRWFPGGPVVTYVPSRFTQIGEHRGFPVYVERGRDGGAIYIAVSEGADLMVAPYVRKK